VKDMNGLRERLVEVGARLQQNVIDDAIDHAVVQTPACLHSG